MENAGIVIDVSEMTQVEVDRRSGIATIGTDWRNIALTQTLGSEGLVVPTVACPTPAIAGLTLGGGHPIQARTWGLTQDHLLELEMVDAKGRVIRANDNNLPICFGHHVEGEVEISASVPPLASEHTALTQLVLQK